MINLIATPYVSLSIRDQSKLFRHGKLVYLFVIFGARGENVEASKSRHAESCYARKTYSSDAEIQHDIEA
jgi:hypothetical protein